MPGSTPGYGTMQDMLKQTLLPGDKVVHIAIKSGVAYPQIGTIIGKAEADELVYYRPGEWVSIQFETKKSMVRDYNLIKLVQ